MCENMNAMECGMQNTLFSKEELYRAHKLASQEHKFATVASIVMSCIILHRDVLMQLFPAHIIEPSSVGDDYTDPPFHMMYSILAVVLLKEPTFINRKWYIRLVRSNLAC